MNNLKNIKQFNTDTEEVSEKVVKDFKNFDENTVNENAEIELSREEIMTKRNEIASKISELEEVDTSDNDATVDTDASSTPSTDIELELELESLKKEYEKIQLLAEKLVFTHKSVVKK